MLPKNCYSPVGIIWCLWELNGKPSNWLNSVLLGTNISGLRGKLTAINLQRTGRMPVMIAFIVTPTIYNFPNGFFVTRKKDSSNSVPAPVLNGGKGSLGDWRYHFVPYIMAYPIADLFKITIYFWTLWRDNLLYKWFLHLWKKNWSLNSLLSTLWI